MSSKKEKAQDKRRAMHSCALDKFRDIEPNKERLIPRHIRRETWAKLGDRRPWCFAYKASEFRGLNRHERRKLVKLGLISVKKSETAPVTE